MVNQQELRQKWEEREFNYEEIEEWINIGLTLNEYEFASWLRDEKSKNVENFTDPQWVKFNTDLEELRKEFFNNGEESNDEFKSPYEEEIANFQGYEDEELWREEASKKKINAQQWINNNHPKKERKNTKELYINENLEGELDLSGFTKLEKVYISHFVDEDKIEIKDKEKYEDKIVKLVNAQEYLEKYLEENYPRKPKSEIKEINVGSRNLEGSLKINGFTNLEELYFDNNKLTNLEVIDCPKLKKLYCPNNYLKDVSFLKGLNHETLINLYIHNNNFEEQDQDLEIFRGFINLTNLSIGNNNEEKIKKGIYNRFYGSLEPLKDLNKLIQLNISNTDIDSNLEHLPESIEKLSCEVASLFDNTEVGPKVRKIREQLVSCDGSISTWREWNRRGFDSKKIKQWKEKEIGANDYDFAGYLKKVKGYKNISELDKEEIEKSRKDFKEWIKIAQNYINNYSEEEKEKIVKLDISKKGLEGSLDLRGFDNLKELNLSNNQITELKLENCTNLESLNCSGNSLEKTDFLVKLNPKRLTYLSILNNNFKEKDLLFLNPFTKLEKIYLGNDDEERIKKDIYNRFAGSLECLQNLTNLKIIDISNTDINEGLESLFDNKNVKEIHCSTKERSNSNVKLMSEQINKNDLFFLSDGKYIRKITFQQAFDEKYLDASKLTLINLSDLDLNVESGLEIKNFPSLKKVFSSSSVHKLNKLSIDDCPQLEEIEISYSRDNKELKIDNCPNLTDLNCSNNQISELNLQKFSNLKKLDCSSNKLVNLELPQDLQLEEIKIGKNDSLSKLNEELKGSSSFIFHNDKYVKKQNAQDWLEENFPKDRVIDVIGYDGKKRSEIKYLNISERDLVGELDLSGFDNLKEFNCSNNRITVLNLSDCSNLEKLNCYNNEITALNLDECSKLKELQCYSNKLENLSISNLNKLEKLSCYDNLIKNLSFSSLNSKKLVVLNIKNNNLSEQNIKIFSNFAKLKELLIGNDNKEKINDEKFNRFVGSLNSLKELVNLRSLHISNTDINEGNIEDLPEKLSISRFYFSTEDKSNNEAKETSKKLYDYLTKKRLDEMYPNKNAKVLNNLYSEDLKGCLDLSEYKDLEELKCNSNQLTNLDVSKNKKLKKLLCHNNKLKKIDIKNNIELTSLQCEGNQLETLLGIKHCSKLFSLNDINEEEGIKKFLHKFLTTEGDKDKTDELAKKITKNKKVQDKKERREKHEGEWKRKKVNDWLEEEYPKDGKCLGKFDWENKGKKRGQIKELDISGEELIGELSLEGFDSLKHLICHDNQLEIINLSDCKQLEIINCRNNKLKKIVNNDSALKLKEFRGSDNKFTDLKSIIGHINSKNLNYLDINKNEIYNGNIGDFAKFTKLKRLFVSNNKFTGSLKELESLNELLEIDIRNSEVIKIENFLEGDEKSWPKKLEKVYYTSNKNKKEQKDKNSKETIDDYEQKMQRWTNYYNKEGEFYDINDLRKNNKRSDYSEVKVILKTPLLSTDKKHKVATTKDNYGTKKIDYHNEGKAIYPSEKETGFGWEIGESLSSSDLPIRLCDINGDALKLFSIKKYFEKNDIKEINSKNEESLTINYEDGENEVKNINKEPELQEIKSYLVKNKKNSLSREELKNAKIEIKKRVECDNAKHYAILSYSWGGRHREEIEWSPEEAEKRLSPGGIKSLNKAIKTLRVLNEFHLLEGDNIEYLWMDQLCVNQDNPKEKGHEVSKMRDYYGNSTVTLVAIHADVGEEDIKKLIKSFEKGESGLIYPNEIIENSLPILKKIMGSEWFSRSWTFQEGFLSKRTIFMFDDFLIDGRFMALIWKLKQYSSIHYEECEWMKDLCREKAATPVGWVYYEGKNKKGYNLGDKASLRLTEALWAVKDRGRALPIDGIYSIIGLLPYSDKVKVNYEKDPESVLREVMLIAVSHGHGEPLAWSGWGSRKLGLCWVPAIDESGSSSVTGGIKVDYDTRKGKLSFEPNEGISIRASEYVISKKSSGLYEVEMKEAMEGSFWMREVWIKFKGNEKKLILSGTKEGMEAVSEKRVLIFPNRETWKGDKPFAMLALKFKNEREDEDTSICHRIDLVRIEEGYENLVENYGKETEKPKNEEKTFIIGLDNQQYQTQVEFPPKK